MRSDYFGLLFMLVCMKCNESKKWRFSTDILRILVTSIINSDPISVPKDYAAKTASYARELCEITYFIREWSGQPEIINLPPGSSHNMWVVLPHSSQLTNRLGFTFRTHFVGTYMVRKILKRHITLLNVLCALHTKGNVQKPVLHLTRFK